MKTIDQVRDFATVSPGTRLAMFSLLSVSYFKSSEAPLNAQGNKGRFLSHTVIPLHCVLLASQRAHLPTSLLCISVTGLVLALGIHGRNFCWSKKPRFSTGYFWI